MQVMKNKISAKFPVNILRTGITKFIKDMGRREGPLVHRAPKKCRILKFLCPFFRTGFRSFDGRQESGAMGKFGSLGL
jgi:hypothetical protein